MKMIPLLALLITTTTAFGQSPHAAEVKEAVERLSYLEGKWQGEGKYIFGPDQVATAQVTEVATFRLGRTLLMLEGKGVATFPDGSERNVHDAIGLITFDPQAEKYTFRTYRAGGETLDPAIEVGDDGIVWSFKQQNRTMRFTTKIKDTVWTEGRNLFR